MEASIAPNLSIPFGPAGSFIKSAAVAYHLSNLLSPPPFVPYFYLFIHWPNKNPTLDAQPLLLLHRCNQGCWRKSHTCL